MKVLLLIEKGQGNKMCVSLPLTTPPWGASSPSKVIKQADAAVHRERAVQRWTTVWRGTRRTQGAISLWLGWHGSPCSFQGEHPFSPSVYWLHSEAQRGVEIFLPFSGKELSRGTQDQQFLFTEVLTVTCPCIGHGRKNQTLLLHPWEKCRFQSAFWHFTLWFLHSGIKINSDFDQTHPEVNQQISVTAPLLPPEKTSFIIISLQFAFGISLNLRVGLLSFIFFHSWQICEGF